MRAHRFLVTDLTGNAIAVTGTDRHHAVDVLRLRVGDRVVVFDGKGLEAAALIESITTNDMKLRLLETPSAAGRIAIPLTLAVAAPKGARADWLVEKCAEFGVHRLTFIQTTRTVVQPGAGKLDRWRRKAVEAAKQSGSSTIMSIEAGEGIAEVLNARDRDEAAFFGATRSDARSLADRLLDIRNARDVPSGVICFIGPEGGWTDEEVTELTNADVVAVSLGPTILRVETAAVAMAAIWSAAC